jgi:hypothetical protein
MDDRTAAALYDQAFSIGGVEAINGVTFVAAARRNGKMGAALNHPAINSWARAMDKVALDAAKFDDTRNNIAASFEQEQKMAAHVGNVTIGVDFALTPQARLELATQRWQKAAAKFSKHSSRRAGAQLEMEEAAREVQEAREALVPVEPTSGAVRFSRRFVGGKPISYDFAAVRAGNGRWYTTGPTCPLAGYTWKGLVAFAREADPQNVILELASSGAVK